MKTKKSQQLLKRVLYISIVALVNICPIYFCYIQNNQSEIKLCYNNKLLMLIKLS